ncbi:dTMP kinase [Cohnella fermenti]|uniref:Thymidylate kinase n=1 Tax=Cohnella fermenti TaxID=2565925 RepID=A0A4S4BJ61_9BACL|nr:dTMP kinase [Cohnella fermenti]THF74462.1 dTMP kinase [Cohnella fermenti]
MTRGYLLSVEGNEGAGKSTVLSMAAEYLASKGIEVVMSREPGGIAIAEQIRSVILDKNNIRMDARTEALLYAASRRQHFVEKIVPTLEAGRTILCDRFIDSSLAYQGYARGIGIDRILAINQFAIEDTFPDLTLFLDVDPELGLARINANKNREVNRLDLEALGFHQRVREGYLMIAERFPDRIVRIDANRTVEEVLEAMKRELDSFLERKSRMS